MTDCFESKPLVFERTLAPSEDNCKWTPGVAMAGIEAKNLHVTCAALLVYLALPSLDFMSRHRVLLFPLSLCQSIAMHTLQVPLEHETMLFCAADGLALD